MESINQQRSLSVSQPQWTRSYEFKTIRLLIYAVNGVTVFFISQLISQSTKLICANFDARLFLERLRYVPHSPSKVFLVSFGLFLLLLACYPLHRWGKRFSFSEVWQGLMVLSEIAICMGIMVYQDMGNKGILLVPAMHVLMFSSNKWLKEFW